MSLRFRINLLITALMLAFILATSLIVLDDVRRSIREEIDAGTRVSVQLLTTVVYSSQFLPGAHSQQEILLGFLQHLGRVRANEIRLYASGAQPIYVSPPSRYKAGRDAPSWFSRLVAPEVAPVTLMTRDGRILIIPDASRSTLDAWDDLSRLAWIALGFFVLTNVLLFWLVGRALRPIDAVLDALSGIKRGRLDVRLPRFPLPEFRAISDVFNRMVTSLAQSTAENRRLALAVKQASDAILILDSTGAVGFSNPAAQRLFGLADRGDQRIALIDPRGQTSDIGHCLQSARGVVENMETRVVARDGRVIDVALSAAPLVDPTTGQVMGEICVLRDISSSKRAAEAERALEQNRQLSQRVHEHLEQERRNLARELHDELGQSVTAIHTIGASIAQRTLGGDAQLHSSARTIVSLAGQLHDAVHGVVKKLRPAVLDDLELAETLEDLVSDMQLRYPRIRFELRLEGNLAGLAEGITTSTYRIVQESLTNVVRHAEASSAEVRVTRCDGGLEIRVSDDGKGMEPKATEKAGHFGVLGMRERVEALGGEFALQARAEGGLSVLAVIPLEALHDSDAPGPLRSETME